MTPNATAAATRQDWCSICAMTLRGMASFVEAETLRRGGRPVSPVPTES